MVYIYVCVYGEVTVEDRKSEIRTTPSIVYYYYYLFVEGDQKKKTKKFGILLESDI